MSVQPLPIDPLIPEIVRTVERNPLTLLEAAPGAGKTTRVPPALLRAGFEHVFVLEPRRIAARLAAKRVAEEAGAELGDFAGYQVRFETVGGSRTRLWYLTEGVFTRRLLARNLPDGAAVVLDEFHERHLETDLALALLRKLWQSKSNLNLLIMSATLGAQDLVTKLGQPPLITAPGKVFPVTIRYTPHSAAPLEEQVASAVRAALSETKGHILVFLPGAGEIRKAIQACQPIARRASASILPLHGDLSAAEQDAAVAPTKTRKIICSTNVAESSITIDGVEAVIDSGLARVLSHSPWSGLSRLQVQKIAQSSAIQRAGRAGRTAPGLAIRLFSEADFVRRPAHLTPEILRADLAQLVLQLAASSLHCDDLIWLDSPPPDMRAHAEDLLARLGALDASRQITPDGVRMGSLAVHPRLARILIAGSNLGTRREGCELVARLAEGYDRQESAGRFSSDIDALLAQDLTYSGRMLVKQLLQADLASSAAGKPVDNALEQALLSAFPDRVARRRGEALLLSNGGSAKLDRTSHFSGTFLVAVEVDDRSGHTSPLVRIASPIEPDWLVDMFPERIGFREELAWNRQAERVEQVNSMLYDRLVIDESRSAPRDPLAASAMLVQKAKEVGLQRFTAIDELNRFLSRAVFTAEYGGFAISPNIAWEAVAQLAAGLTSFAQLEDAASVGRLIAVLETLLPMHQIDEIAPSHIKLPSGRRARIEYAPDQPPSVSSRLQDFFGMKETPTVARGRIPIVVHLLAPNQRPVQVTTDLVSFWKNLYPQVRRELSRRYPKHSWPEQPA